MYHETVRTALPHSAVCAVSRAFLRRTPRRRLHSAPRVTQDRSVEMPLIYAFVARRTTVLAEFTNYSGNFSTIAIQVRARANDARRARDIVARGSNDAVPSARAREFHRVRARDDSANATRTRD